MDISQLPDYQFIRQRANAIRQAYFNEMEKNLLAFEQHVNEHGITVQWINDENDLYEAIENSLKKRLPKVCIDFGKDEIPDILQQQNKWSSVSVSSLEQDNIVDTMVVKADFGVVDSGDLVFVNKPSQNCFNKVTNLVIVLEISKLVVRQNDLETILYLQSLNRSGTFLPPDVKIVNSTMLHSPASTFLTSETPQIEPEKVNIRLLLYNNGVTDLMQHGRMSAALYCIDCGKCKTVCPVFAVTQRFSPIDVVTLNCRDVDAEMREHTTLCGNCNEVCPVQIPFTDLIINELEQEGEGRVSRNESMFKTFSRRSKMNSLSGRVRHYFFVRKYYGSNKKLNSYFQEQREPFFNIQMTKP